MVIEYRTLALLEEIAKQLKELNTKIDKILELLNNTQQNRRQKQP